MFLLQSMRCLATYTDFSCVGEAETLYQIIFSIAEILFWKLAKLSLTAVSFFKTEENVFPANFVTP